MRYYTSRLPASQFCPTGYTSACWGWKPTEILEEYLASGTETPWVLEDFLIVIQCGLKLCTSTRLQTFWMLWKSSQLKCRAEAQPICLHWLVVPRSFPCIPDHSLWFVPSFSLCLSGRWSFHLQQPASGTAPSLSCSYNVQHRSPYTRVPPSNAVLARGAGYSAPFSVGNKISSQIISENLLECSLTSFLTCSDLNVTYNK